MRWAVVLLAYKVVLAASNPCAEAIEAHQAGRIAAALPIYEECLKGNSSAELRSNYGAALAHEGRYSDAAAQYQLGLQSAPGHPQLLFNLALAHYKQGDVTRAAAELKSLHERSPQNMQINLLLADCYLRLAELPEAIALLGPLEAGHSADPGFAYLLGTALIRSGDVQRGQLVVETILKDGNSPEAHFLLASAAFSQRDYPSAVREFESALKARRDLPQAWSFYGQALLFTGDADGAAVAFRKELSGNPNDYEANVKLGAILAARKDYEAAMPYLEKAAALRPESAEAKAELAAARAGHPVSTSTETGLLAKQTVAPAFSLKGLTREGTVTAEGPVVLVFGSYTCPKFRFGAPILNRLYERYGARVPFKMVYVQEAHDGGEWQSTINTREGIDQPPARNTEEKISYATSCARKLHIPYPLAADGMDRAVENAYHAWPSAVYIIDRDGRIAWASRLGELELDAVAMEAAVREVVGQ
jgi:tetratricopeptide (TPR) repeat protein